MMYNSIVKLTEIKLIDSEMGTANAWKDRATGEVYVAGTVNSAYKEWWDQAVKVTLGEVPNIPAPDERLLKLPEYLRSPFLAILGDYLHGGLSYSQLAARYSFSSTVIYRNLKKMGVIKHPRK